MSQDSLLNALDGAARYEARMEMLRGDPTQVLPKLKQMLENGTARYPHEIKALIEMIEDGRAADVPRFVSAASKPDYEPPPPPTEAERIESLVRRVGDPIRVNKQVADHAHRRLVEIGAPAVEALVTWLYDDRAKKRRFALLKVLGEIAAQGVDSAREAIIAASTHDERSISGPAQAVRRELETDD